MSSVPRSFARFLHYNPFHNIIHYYVDLSTFLITSDADTFSPRIWWALNRRKGTSSFYSLEVQYRGPQSRDRYVFNGFQEVRRTKRTFLARRLGFHDLFVPILSKGKLVGYLQAGAFADQEVTIETLTRCWKELSGRGFSPDLPEFRVFTRALLEIPVLDGPLAPAFQEALELCAQLLGGEGDEEAIGERLHQLQNEVFSKGLPHSYWLEWALGRPTSESVPAWSRTVEKWGWIKSEIGLTRIPTTVLTVIPQRTGPSRLDWARETLRTRHFQRESFKFAQTLPETVGGRLDDYGAVFVTSADPKLPRLAQKKWIEGVAQKVRDFAVKELGGPVVVGVGDTVAPGEPLNPSFRQAVLALHLWKGSESDVVQYEGKREDIRTEGFGALRETLDRLEQVFASAAFSDLEVLKEQFLKQAIQLSFQNPQEIRWHIQYVLDRLARTAAVRLDLSAREARELRDGLMRTLEQAATFQEILLAYHKALGDLEREVERPFVTRQDQSLERAREYLEKHFKEPLRIGPVAKRSGISVSTFSRRFKKLTGLGWEGYLQKRRLDEAKRLLRTTRLPVFRIARDCGFRSNPYFIQLFRKKNGKTPQEFRQKP